MINIQDQRNQDYIPHIIEFHSSNHSATALEYIFCYFNVSLAFILSSSFFIIARIFLTVNFKISFQIFLSTYRKCQKGERQKFSEQSISIETTWYKTDKNFYNLTFQKQWKFLQEIILMPIIKLFV